LFHAFPNLLPGGFFGVDVFFIISGYLIAGIIFRGLKANNFSYFTFYAKRIRRIIPNLMLVLLFVTTSGTLFMSAEEFTRLGKHIQASTFFYENFQLLSEANYFDISSQFKPLLHLWSLAIEEQFYIFFPAIAAGLWALTKKITSSAKIAKIALGILVCVLTLGSFIACVTQSNPTHAFYYPRCRFWELGIGIVFVWAETFGFVNISRITLGLRNILSAIGFILIIAAITLYSKNLSAPGWFSLLPTLGAVILIAAGPDAILNRTILSWRWMTFIGLISYSVYLWHWPILAYMHIVHPFPTTWMAIAALLISIIISTIIYFIVELPVRRTSAISAKRLVYVLLGIMCLSWLTGYEIVQHNGFPQRPYVQRTKDYLPHEDEWSHLRTMKAIYSDQHLFKVVIGEEEPTILFAGDSHTAQYSSLIEKLSEQHNKSVEILAGWGFGCLAFTNNITAEDACKNLQNMFLRDIKNKNIKTIVIAQRWDDRLSQNDYILSKNKKIHFSNGGFELALRDLLFNIRPDQKLYVLLDNPGGKEYDPRFAAFNRWTVYLNGKPTPAVVKIKYDAPWNKANQIVKNTLKNKAILIDVTSILFPFGYIDISKSYYNENHMRGDWLKDNTHFFDNIFSGNSQ
jgi:peptidoglycan/LPS O-acetylase OafA/YrhL